MTYTFATKGPAVGLVLFLCTKGLAAGPGFWQAATQSEFLRGQVDQLSIDQHGRLTLGPAVERVFDGAVSVVWAMVRMPDGTEYVGTGNDGKVFKVSPDGRGEVLYDSAELQVHALAAAPGGGLYVGTSPEGRIYRLSPSGEATPVFDPEDKYIWALATDARGTVYAATGDPGRVYRITPDGKGEMLFDTKATHAMTLAVEPSGRVLVGTGSPGRVFSVDGAGKGFLLLDTPYQEVRSLTLGPGGAIYAAALNGRAAGSAGGDATEAPAAPAPQPTSTVSTEIMAFAIIDAPVTPQGSTSPTPTAAPGGPFAGAVYRIRADGLWDVVWESKDDSPYDIEVDPDGSLVVATGNSGKVFRLSGDPIQATLLARVPAQHVTTLRRVGGRTLLATANPGLVVAMSGTRAAKGTYESDVKDARLVASWGVVSWRAVTPAGTSVEVYTRSGNTRTPDEAWSDWSGPYTVPAGSPITSPSARYLQWRAVLTGGTATPVLTSLSAAFLPRNVRPRVESVTVHPPGVVFQKPFSTGETEIAGFDEDPDDRRLVGQAGPGQGATPALGRRIYRRGLQTLQWKAGDENDDELTYDVHYRREGETAWRPLRTGLRDSLTVWDTTSVPNGTYIVKVVASDTRSNSADRALTGELESASFDIDNASPTVTIGPVRRDGERFIVAIDVRDADSPVKRVEYSLDAQRWQAAFPRDGILDSPHESFELRLDADVAGRVLVVRATDALNNVGASEVLLPGSR